MECNKSSSKRKVHTIQAYLKKQQQNIPNEQANFTPKGTRKRTTTTQKTPKLIEERK